MATISKLKLGSSIENYNDDLNNNLNSLNSDISSLNSRVTTEVTDLENQINTLNSKVDSSVDELNNTITSTETELDTKITTLDSKVYNEVETLTNNINSVNTTLDEKITTLDSRVTTEVENINSSITNEISTLNGSINTLQSDLSREVQGLTELINTEASKRQTQDIELTNQINLTNDKLNEEVLLRQQGDTELTNSISQLQQDITTSLAAKSDDTAVVHNTGNETINGQKTFGDNTYINADMYINGNIYQQGDTYITQAERVEIKQSYIITRTNATAGLSSAEKTGIIARKYDGDNDGALVFGNDGVARVGDVTFIGDEIVTNSTQPLATREENPTDKGFAKWDNIELKFVTDTDVATETALNQETQEREIAITNLQANIDSEANARETSDNNIQLQIAELDDKVAKTSQSNTFTDSQTINGDLTISGSLTDGTNSIYISNIASKDYVDTLLEGKAESGDFYSKTEVDSLLSEKSDSGVSYTKSETDNLVSLKADRSTTYSKNEVNNLITANSGGNYLMLTNQPSINGLVLVGDKSAHDLGLALLEDAISPSAVTILLNGKTYTSLVGKPTINGVTIDGNLTSADLGITSGSGGGVTSYNDLTDKPIQSISFNTNTGALTITI